MTKRERLIACAAVRMWAWWHDGVEEVGTMRKRYKDVAEDIMAGKFDFDFDPGIIEEDVNVLSKEKEGKSRKTLSEFVNEHITKQR